jgi:arylsulfatase A-like enzyme
MSGLMPARNGALPNHSGLSSGIKTLPSYLAEAGYHVAHFGKSHFQPRANYPDMEWVPSEIKGGTLNNDLDTNAFERWLEDKPRQPCCLIVCSHSPHVFWPENAGYDPARVELPPTFVDTPETRSARTSYYTDITLADRQLGVVYEACRRRLGENTLFIYTSDNGAQWPFAKWSLYDAGIRVPFIAAWPGVIKPGSKTGALISFCDLLPTFLELAGARVPQWIDGKSFATVMRGTAREHRSEVYAAHSGDGNMNVYPMRAVRTEQFKYILNLHPEFEYTTHIDRAGDRDGKSYWESWVRKARNDASAAAIVRRYHRRPAEELYDTQADPHEMRNLAAEARQARMLADLRARVKAWMKSQDDEGRVFGTPRLLSRSGL